MTIEEMMKQLAPLMQAVPEKEIDMLVYGAHITKDGERIDPREFYIASDGSDPKPPTT